MLDELAVANLGVLQDARIAPGPGLVVFTGETGTGKTLLLGALRLLLGGTARKDQIGPHGAELTVEGRFVFDDEESAVARKVTETRGRAYLDGSMVPSKVLADRLGRHVEVVGQHDALSLADAAVVREVIDRALPADAGSVLDRYVETYRSHQRVLERRSELGGDLRSVEREIEMLEYQAAEIHDAAFENGDDTALATQAERLRNAGAIAEALSGALERLETDAGAVDALGEATDDLLRAARLDPTLASLTADATALVDAATGLAGELRRIADGLGHEPAQLDDIESRLGLLADLKRKYGDSLEGVIEFGASAASRATELREVLEGAAGLAGEIEKSVSALGSAGAALTEVRRRQAARIAKDAMSHLGDLGFSAPVVEFAFEDAPAAAHGTDRITLRFASDPALEPAAVGRIASAGELSRLVLSVRLAAGAVDARVLVFDEIDAGIGGATAYAMGSKLASLAGNRQVLCVTHLPQIAAFASEHWVVERDGAAATVRKVDGEPRVDELARMLSGLAGSASGRHHAAELLATATADTTQG